MAGWQKMLEYGAFTEVVIGDGADTFGGANGEDKARAYDVYDDAFLASKPGRPEPEMWLLYIRPNQRRTRWLLMTKWYLDSYMGRTIPRAC